MRLHDNTGRRPILPAWGAAGLGLLLFCILASLARADEWNDTFSSPREFLITQNMTARSGPSNNYDALGIVPKGTSIWVTNITNGWHCFKLIDGSSAYIFRRYLKPAQGGKTKKNASKAEVEQKKQKAATKQPAKKRREKAEAKAPEKPEPESKNKTVAESDDDYDEPIVHYETDGEPDKTGQKQEAAPPVTHQDPPEPPLLADIPQGPEDEPVPPKKTEKAAEEAEDAVKPEKRPVRSSSFGTDGCENYRRVSFASDASETLLQGKLVSGKRLCYRFLGIEGNTVSLTLQPADSAAFLDVFTPASGHVAEKQKTFSWRCVSTGDKVIVVHAAKAATYALQVKIQR